MGIVLLNMGVSVVVIIIIIVVAVIWNLLALSLVILYLVTRARAKKRGQKATRAPLFTGIALFLLPWLIIGGIIMISKIYNWKTNYIETSELKKEVCEAVVNGDAEALYELFAPAAIEESGLTVEDLQAFLDNVGDIDKDDYREDKTGQHNNNLAKDKNVYSFYMYDLFGTEAKLYFGTIYRSSKSPDVVGLYGIRYIDGDKMTDDPFIGVLPNQI